MNKDAIYRELVSLTAEDCVRLDVPMKDYTTFRTGGTADVMVEPSCTAELAEIICMLNREDIPYYVLGNGSNVLVKDQGYRGVIIIIGKKMSAISITGTTMTVQAGALLSAAARAACEQSLEGMEFASGIPGSMGGAVFMNAGAYGGEMKQILVSASAVTADGSVVRFSASEMDLGYRHSAFEENGAIVTEAVLALRYGDQEAIIGRMKDLAERRRSKQPLHLPSAGSTFKRPPGYFAGKLIDDAHMRGASVGDAQVSPKHAGFIVNNGHASAGDILELIELVQMRVLETSGVHLEREVRVIGE